MYLNESEIFLFGGYDGSATSTVYSIAFSDSGYVESIKLSQNSLNDRCFFMNNELYSTGLELIGFKADHSIIKFKEDQLLEFL